MAGAKGEKVNEFATSVVICDTRRWLNILIMNQILENILRIKKICLGIEKAVSLWMSLVIYSSSSFERVFMYAGKILCCNSSRTP